MLNLEPLWPLGCGALVRKEWSCLFRHYFSLLPSNHLPIGLRVERSVLPYGKLSFCWESYKPEKLVRTPASIVLNSNEICHAWEKRTILVTASAWDSQEPEASCRAVAVRAAAIRRSRIANLLIFKLTPALRVFWFGLGTVLNSRWLRYTEPHAFWNLY